MKKALIVGATGLVGKQILLELLANESYESIYVFSRRKLTVTHAKLKVQLHNLDSLNEIKLDVKIDECYCTLGTTLKKAGKEGQIKVDYQYVYELAKLCKRLSIPKFLVVSSQGANHQSNLFYLRLKGQMEEAIKKLNISTLFIVRPSLITGEREEKRIAETIGSYIYKALNPLMVGNLKKYRPVSGNQIAKCMIDLAQNAEKGTITIESDFIQSY
ncbi:MAG: NAD-dependent epimerase/dehydratase family protein [Prolixibacteraceae bacterium]|jgi:uncharacterized protein YbjT (DUF2867 family)|nr:NAD-dependent epimerase/dehydratase family protein [Prolixibacteraceae bacterium]